MWKREKNQHLFTGFLNKQAFKLIIEYFMTQVTSNNLSPNPNVAMYS